MIGARAVYIGVLRDFYGSEITFRNEYLKICLNIYRKDLLDRKSLKDVKLA